VSIVEIIPFEIKFEMTVFETKIVSRKKFRKCHFRGSRSLYLRLMTFPKKLRFMVAGVPVVMAYKLIRTYSKAIKMENRL